MQLIDQLCNGLVNELKDYDSSSSPGLYDIDDFAKPILPDAAYIGLGEELVDDSEEYHKEVDIYARLEELDEGQPPHKEWELVICPYLKSKGLSPHYSKAVRSLRAYSAILETTDHGLIGLTVVKASKLPPSKFIRENRLEREQRWNRSGLNKYISELWKQVEWSVETWQAQIVLLIGFDHAQDNVFESELSKLRESLNWDKKGVTYSTVAWSSTHEPSLGIRLAIWSQVCVKPTAGND